MPRRDKLRAMRDRHRAEESKILRTALQAEGWVQARAARRLGVGPSTLQRAISRHPELLRAIDGRV